MRFFTIIILFLTVIVANAQNTDITTLFMSDWQKAERHYEKWAYKNAIELYERVLDKNPNELRAKIRIAECYAELNELDLAVNWYRQIIDFSDLNPIHYYNFAQALSMIGDYDEAKIWYEVYGEQTEDIRSKLKLDFIEVMDQYRKDPSMVYFNNLKINSENSDFGMTPFKDGFVFLSARDQDLFIKYKDSYQSALDDEDPYESRLDLYFTGRTDSGFVSVEKVHDINTRFHEGPLTFFHDGKQVIFTRNNFYEHKKQTSKDGKIKLKLFTAKSGEEGHWENIQPFPYNSDEHSTGHPALNLTDDILYFSSDMPGGIGGSDIYYSVLQNGKWGSPVNLGPEINTPGDEMFPYFSYDGNLYFSSDGHGGFGGLDIYRAYPKGVSFGSVENLGTPLNSRKDDFAFYLDKGGRTGFLSSNRKGGIGSDDIYEFNIQFLGIIGRVFERYSNDLIPGAEVIVTDENTQKTYLMESDEDGQFRLDLPIDSKYYLVAQKEGYSEDGYTRVSSEVDRFETDTVNVYMWKHRLFAEGRIFSNETQQLMGGATVTVDDLTDDKHVEMITGPNGSYFYVLRPDRKYKFSAEAQGHIPKSFILNTAGMNGEDTLKNDIVLEETYIDKTTVFFDFDKSDLKGEAIQEINQMIEVLKKHKETFMVISAHADAQGTIEYNKALSDRRALSVVKYLRSKGIKEDRIDWFGFGEQLLLNQCSDGVECEEEDHSKNRRAELKIEDLRSSNPDI
ncbi:MAG: OmpA family protein [Cyclobacteriaceae bacterium]|nr:OmpA family protein [Cyclobacteriaceae bacterium SS2]